MTCWCRQTGTVNKLCRMLMAKTNGGALPFVHMVAVVTVVTAVTAVTVVTL